MAHRLLGKIALVTGAAKGIGLACARALGNEGAAVMLADMDSKAGAAAADELSGAGIRAAFLEWDVTSKVQVDAAVLQTVQKLGGLDIVVANAGEPPP
jgi:NAD(P)-dependent dehydrogenase (short-subunit alcohol dehydrogenase family)